jgi:hypothetical protein
MELGKYSIGMGDRFGQEGEAQLKAILIAKEKGVEISPVWNKSMREHSIVHSVPDDIRAEADAAVKALGFTEPYFVDADHINLSNVDGFIAPSNFFTLDVSDYIGKPTPEQELDNMVSDLSFLCGKLHIEGIQESFEIDKKKIKEGISKYVLAVKEAGKIYNHIKSKKGTTPFIPEFSIDETDAPQSPLEMLFVLAAIAKLSVPIQTVAPKFIGRFNKGVDYVGDVGLFTKQFEEHVLVLNHAIKNFGLSKSCKLSVHSGSDKFSLYPIIKKIIKRHNVGLHLKTAGTTWLEEVNGLALSGGEGLAVAKEIYIRAFLRFDELCGPYKTVIDITPSKLPAVEEVKNWSSEKYVNTINHDQSCKDFSTDFRQFIHVSYKIAVELGVRFTEALKNNRKIIAKSVNDNLFVKHITPLYLEKQA